MVGRWGLVRGRPGLGYRGLVAVVCLALLAGAVGPAPVKAEPLGKPSRFLPALGVWAATNPYVLMFLAAGVVATGRYVVQSGAAAELFDTTKTTVANIRDWWESDHSSDSASVQSALTAVATAVDADQGIEVYDADTEAFTATATALRQAWEANSAPYGGFISYWQAAQDGWPATYVNFTLNPAAGRCSREPHRRA